MIQRDYSSNSYQSQIEPLREEGAVFSSRQDTLSFAEATYYQDLLYRTVKIGTEIEFALPKGAQRGDLEPALRRILEPSQSMDDLGRLGVYDISKEHCGIEIRVIGRHPHWGALLSQYQQIIEPLLQHNVRIRPTCGLHFHLIGIGLSEPIPELIMANLWNIMRRYAPGIKFLTSGGESQTALCRRRQHNAHQEFVKQSPELTSMQDIQLVLRESFDVPEHQNFFNLEHLLFTPKGELQNFHVEFRFPDGDLSAHSITAKTFLFLVMMLKAVEISKFGLLHVGSTKQFERKVELLDLISNNNGKLATSDTSEAWSFLQEYQENSQSLLRFLKSTFILLDNPAEMILQSLSKRPVSLRRCEGLCWQEIDTELERFSQPEVAMDRLDYRIVKVVELGLVSQVDMEQEWLVRTAEFVNCQVDELKKRLVKYRQRKPVWSEELGRIVFFR